MENNNQNANWQEAINEMSQTASEQVNQTVENVQQSQPVQPEQPAQPHAEANGWFTAPDNQNVYDAGDFAVLPAKKKSNKTLIIVLVIVAAAILIGGGIFLLLTMNKSSGYESLERNYFSGLTEQIGTVTTQTKTGADMKITLTPGSSMTGGMEVAPTVLKGKAYADAESLKTYAELTYAAGEEDIANLKTWIENEVIYVQIPELTDIIVKLDMNEGLLKISAVSSAGSTYDELMVDHQGEDIIIAFNNRFLIDSLRASDAERVKISMTSALTSINIEPDDDDTNTEDLFMLLPVRMKE